MTEQQQPFGESDQMWVPATAMALIASGVQNTLAASPESRDQAMLLERSALRSLVAALRHPEPAAVDWAVQKHSCIRNRAQLVRDLHAYADALEQVILPAVRP